MRRDFARGLIHGQGIWRAPVADQQLYPTLKRFNELGTFAMQLDRKPSADIAVIVDEISMMYETPKYNLDLACVSNQIYQGIARLGAASDYYFLNDFLDGKLKPYKLYIFLNAWFLDRMQRERLNTQLKRAGGTALWIYASGYIKDRPSMGNMTEVTGFKFAMGQLPWPAFMYVTNFEHQITKGLPQDLFWNYDAALGPLFSIDDKEAEILGNIVFSQGSCVPGLGVKRSDDWKSIYCAMPFLPAPVLRGIARYAGVHLYSGDGDVLHASKELVCIHSISGGQRTIELPYDVEVVYDLFEGNRIAGNTKSFDVSVLPASTNLYFTGGSRILEKLKL